MGKILGWFLLSVALLISVIFNTRLALPVITLWSIIGTILYIIGTYSTFKEDKK